MVSWTWGPERQAVPRIKLPGPPPASKLYFYIAFPGFFLGEMCVYGRGVVMFPDREWLTWVTQPHSWAAGAHPSLGWVCTHLASVATLPFVLS